MAQAKLERAVILCGGQGTRLRPVTYEIPKPLIPVQGRSVIEYIIDLLKLYGITDIVLSIGYLKERIKGHFQGRTDVRISFLEEDQPLGTAGPLRLLKGVDGPFVVSNGDELKDIELDRMFELHRKNRALVTIALTAVEDPSCYGVARMEGERIAEFVEKPTKEKAPSKLINSGLYIIEPEVIRMIPEGCAMLEKDVFPKVAQMGRLYGYVFAGQWFDTGTFERYEKAIKGWKGLRKR